MGSTLSIHNDTGHAVYVKVGNDEAAFRIAAIVGAAVGLVSIVLPGVGPVMAALSNGAIVISVSAGTAESVAAVGGLQAGITTIIQGMDKEISKRGYTRLEPGETYKSEKKSLSLWQQCHLLRNTQVGNCVLEQETYMRPICTGATDGSNLQHDVSFWVNRYPWETKTKTPVEVKESAAQRSTASPQNNTRFHPGTYVFTCFHQSHLRSWPEGKVDLTSNRDCWEQWTPVHLGGNKYAWKSLAHGKFLSASPEGHVSVAPWIKEWEHWTHSTCRGGNVWRSYHGTYLRANPNGRVDLAPHAKEWECWN